MKKISEFLSLAALVLVMFSFVVAIGQTQHRALSLREKSTHSSIHVMDVAGWLM